MDTVNKNNIPEISSLEISDETKAAFLRKAFNKCNGELSDSEIIANGIMIKETVCYIKAVQEALYKLYKCVGNQPSNIENAQYKMKLFDNFKKTHLYNLLVEYSNTRNENLISEIESEIDKDGVKFWGIVKFKITHTDRLYRLNIDNLFRSYYLNNFSSDFEKDYQETKNNLLQIKRGAEIYIDRINNAAKNINNIEALGEILQEEIEECNR